MEKNQNQNFKSNGYVWSKIVIYAVLFLSFLCLIILNIVKISIFPWKNPDLKKKMGLDDFKVKILSVKKCWNLENNEIRVHWQHANFELLCLKESYGACYRSNLSVLSLNTDTVAVSHTSILLRFGIFHKRN